MSKYCIHPPVVVTGRAGPPRVTTVLGVIDKGPGLARWIANQGWDNAQRILRTAGQRGTNFHAWLTGQATLPRIVLPADDPDRKPKQAFMRLRRRILSRFDVLSGQYELPVSCKDCGYRGTLDAFLKLRDRMGRVRYVLADWKTSNGVRPEWALQTAAYVHGLVSSHDAVGDVDEADIIRFSFRFGADGACDITRYPDFAGDFFAFKCALGIYRWKQRQ